MLFAASIYWDLPVLLIAVSLVYSATRHDRWDRIVKEAANWIVRMVGFLGGLGDGRALVGPGGLQLARRGQRFRPHPRLARPAGGQFGVAGPLAARGRR